MAAKQPAAAFKLWRPGPLDAARRFLLSESFQSAVQLAAGVLFVSLFVFLDGLRYPGSCVAILLYFVVAVTAAPDCHVGTRVFLCGFMIGPMWLSLLLGGVIATLGKLAPTREGELAVLCVLGSLALVPFAANRMGTSHLYLFAMGMVSCLYLGMPLLAGWAAPDIATLWTHAVGFVLVSALVGMFAGSVLSMIVLPSLASHQIEDEASAALRLLGHHLSASASQLWRPGTTSLQALPRHLEGLHPLLLPSASASQPGVVAPGVLDRDIGAAPVSPRQVYVAAMDWFEHLSRPPCDGPAAGRSKSCFVACRTSSASGSARSELAKNTFWGPSASNMAAAVAAAAQDFEEFDNDFGDGAQLQQQQWAKSWAGRQQATSTLARRQPSALGSGASELRLGSTLTAAAAKAAKAEADQPATAAGLTAAKGAVQPCPAISEVRQLLAHATQLLEAAGAEPQWLRARERPFKVPAWTKLLQAAQLVALRLTALDLIRRDFVSLSEEPHSFPVAEDLSQLLLHLYGSAAAALAMLAQQVGNREQLADTCAANMQILKDPAWHAARQRLLQLLEDTLAEYFVRIQQASPEEPVVIPSAHWVRRWMFFHTTTLSLMTALDGLAAASEAALTAQPHRRSRAWWRRSGRATQHAAQPTHKQQDVSTNSTGAGAADDVEAGLQADGMQQADAAAAAAAGPVQGSGRSSTAPEPPHGDAAARPVMSAPQPQQGPSAAASPPAAAAAGPSGLRARLAGSLIRHTGWIRPWLPLALNMKQYENLRLVAQEVPAAFSSWAAFKTTLRNRRVQAAFKYWAVLVLLLVGTLLLQFFVPVSSRLSPSFGYTAAAVGMSDRVESTVFKILTWTGATVVGAFIGWALMLHPVMALNPVALAAVMVAISFCVGTLERGPGQGGTLFTLFTLTTLASIVLCQCCGSVGSTLVSMTRGASVLVAAVIAVSVQNLVLPWYTSTWALEQVGVVFRDGAEVLADLICQLYEEADELMMQQQTQALEQQQQGGASPPAAAAAAGTPGAGSGSGGQRTAVARLQLLNDAVRRVWLREQQQQQGADAEALPGEGDASSAGQAGQQQQPQQQGLARRQVSFASSVATSRLAELGRAFTGSSQLGQLPQQASAAGSQQADASAGSAGGTAAADAAAAAAAIKSAMSESRSPALSEMAALLQQRRSKCQQQQGPAGAGPARVSVTGLQLQARLLRPLIQVKISLVLDTTAWKSGPLATPSVVLHMVSAMFELVDALAALQQAVALPVKELSGSWDFTLQHVSGSWAALLLQAIQLADATAMHVLQPTAESAQQLLTQIQEVSHKRFEHFAVQREVRRLLHTALATDEVLSSSNLAGVDEWHLQGHLRYSACVYATGKVLDSITAAARCALSESK